MQIYALADIELLRKNSLTFEDYIKKCREKDVEIIQYRDKNSTLKEKKENLQKLRALWEGSLIINDELSLVEYCDGLHLGQEDLAKIDRDFNKAVKKIREIIKSKILGLSTHNKEEILIANSLDVDYIGLGAYRGTSTKKDAKVLGKKLEEIAKYSNKKVAAIGGVKLSDKIENVDYLVIGRGLISAS